MAEIGVGQGAVVTRAQKAVLDLTGNQERDVKIIQAAIDEALAEHGIVPPAAEGEGGEGGELPEGPPAEPPAESPVEEPPVELPEEDEEVEASSASTRSRGRGRHR